MTELLTYEIGKAIETQPNPQDGITEALEEVASVPSKAQFVKARLAEDVTLPTLIAEQAKQIGMNISLKYISSIKYKINKKKKLETIPRIEGESKAGFVKRAQASGINSTPELVRVAKSQGIRLSYSYASCIKSQLKKEQTPFTIAKTRAHNTNYSQLQDAVEFVRKCGGVAKANEMLSIIESLQLSE